MDTTAIANPITRAYQILELVSQNRSVIYRLLALNFTYPDDSLIGLLQSGEIFEVMRNSTSYLGDDQIALLDPITSLEAYSSLSLQSLQSEYANLFEKGISRISPREFAYRWKDACHISQSDNDLRQTLQRQYNSFGVHCDLGSEDHISVELEYLAYLCVQESTNWKQGFSKAARDIRSQERAFVDDHLSRWLPELCYRIRKQVPHSIYFHVALFCDLWFSLDHGSGYVLIKDNQ